MSDKAIIDWHSLPPDKISEIEKDAKEIAESLKAEPHLPQFSTDEISQRIAAVEAQRAKGEWFGKNPTITNASSDYWRKRWEDIKRYSSHGLGVDETKLLGDNKTIDGVEYKEVK